MQRYPPGDHTRTPGVREWETRTWDDEGKATPRRVFLDESIATDDAPTTAPDTCDTGGESDDSDWENESQQGQTGGAPDVESLDVDHMSPAQFVEAQRRLPWPGTPNRPISAELRTVINYLGLDPRGVKYSRQRQLKYWRRRAAAFGSERRRIAAALPPRMRDTIGRLHIPLIRELAAAAEFEDGDFLNALTRGFPLTGDLHAGGVGRRLQEPHVAHGKKAAGRYVPTLNDLRARCPQINAATLTRRPPDPEVAALVCSCLGERPWQAFTYRELFQRCLQLDPFTVDVATLQRTARQLTDPGTLAGGRDLWLDLLLTHGVEPWLAGQGLCFVYDYPASQAALARLAQRGEQCRVAGQLHLG